MPWSIQPSPANTSFWHDIGLTQYSGLAKAEIKFPKMTVVSYDQYHEDNYISIKLNFNKTLDL